jgi:hypothetical protein
MFGLLDHVVRLRGDGRNLLGAHALQVGPELVGVLLGEVVQEQGAVGALRHGEPGGQLAATVPTGCLLAGEVPGGAGGLPKCDSLHTPLHAPPAGAACSPAARGGARSGQAPLLGGEDFKGDSTRIAARARLRSAAGSCPEAAGLAAARFLLRLHPRVRPH